MASSDGCVDEGEPGIERSEAVKGGTVRGRDSWVTVVSHAMSQKSSFKVNASGAGKEDHLPL